MKRRALLKFAPAALAVGAAPALAAVPAANDPIIALCDAWVAAYQEWDAESEKDDGGNFDTPRHKELDIVKERLAEQIEATPITTDAGCSPIALCRGERRPAQAGTALHRPHTGRMVCRAGGRRCLR